MRVKEDDNEERGKGRRKRKEEIRDNMVDPHTAETSPHLTSLRLTSPHIIAHHPASSRLPLINPMQSSS